ncbi:unnamed protein product [Owenia fusiformis]|uniref:Chromatin-remodeling ATPase INO80 n=1 Tax=Owenia fusiformis TaxID=6347 RepID=A0A8J1U0T2_OWEFU|nr:unnamed protein product [Owenia fusiformis]
MSSQAPIAAATSRDLAAPIHIQRVEKALNLNPLLNYVEGMLNDPISGDEMGDSESDVTKDSDTDLEGNQIIQGVVIPKAERRADKAHMYNFSKVKKSRKWLKNILLSDTSSDEESAPITVDNLHTMLKLHKLQRGSQSEFYRDKEMQQYQYYSVGLLSQQDKFYQQQKLIVGPKKKLAKEQKKLMKAKMKKSEEELRRQEIQIMQMQENGEIDPEIIRAFLAQKQQQAHEAQMFAQKSKDPKTKKFTPEQIAAKRRRLWVGMMKKEVSKAQKARASARKEMLQLHKKVAKECVKEMRKSAMQSQRVVKETPMRARRLTREVMTYWKRFEKVEKETRKKAEKEALEQRKMDLNLKEAKRQQRKLNFLITQTELFSHFMSRKITGEGDEKKEQILKRLEDTAVDKTKEIGSGNIIVDQYADDYDQVGVKNRAMNRANAALMQHKSKTLMFDNEIAKIQGKEEQTLESSLANPDFHSEDMPQPSIFEGTLKAYQLKGMNWLLSLYDQGINGILADEMGLGKTVQSIAFLAHLAESQSIWGPFMVIAPASTLHNWQQECAKFIPSLKVVPYWGNTSDRKTLRKFWQGENMHSKDAPFHIVITSYQLVIQDFKYFNRIKWQYMVLDEAQAIKSSASVRWKQLLGFSCRNRLLLTGTPIQNSMAELWALLHFIMPTMFDSHDEFNEWFSKDIENHAEKQSGFDEAQLSRLHMILKPFMLRRVKKDVENELLGKIEILVYCPLTTRQKMLYQGIKNKISIEELIQSASSSTSTSSLMNLVMQFRKVCNHPELFERRDIRTPSYTMRINPYTFPKLIYRDGIIETSLPSKQRILYNMFYIHNPQHIHESLNTQSDTDETNNRVESCFSFTRFINMSAQELYHMMHGGLLTRWLAVFLWLKEAYTIQHMATWAAQPLKQIRYLERRSFLLEPISTTHYTNVSTSKNLQCHIFTSHQSSLYTHCSHTLQYHPETLGHRKIRSRRFSTRGSVGKPPTSPTKKVPTSPLKKASNPGANQDENPLVPEHVHTPRSPKVLDLMPTYIPAFLYYTIPKAFCKDISWYCDDRMAEWERQRDNLCGTKSAHDSLMYGSTEIAEQVRWSSWYFSPTQPGGFYGIHPKHGFSNVLIPDKETLIRDAGKLEVLDSLLARLKAEGHRVLIYSQMTRMIDLLEEYMWHRKHKYMRLDGSSKISDRRDMVEDFQTKSDIFVFLLSTRAGGLGINLTAADTVIFYDSDWNPTVDQQAMDRAHRLGQTKQVTVYRLITKGSIEMRILERAKEKSEIQRMVISGENFKPDVLKAKEVVSLLLEEEELTTKVKQKDADRKQKEEQLKAKDRMRKREQYHAKKSGVLLPKNKPGRKRKQPTEETAIANSASNTTLSSQGEPSIFNYESSSAAASPQSVKSLGGEHASFSLVGDEDSNDGMLIVDDQAAFTGDTSSTPPPTKRGGLARGRGKKTPTGGGRRPRGRGSLRKAISAAEIAGKQAAKEAAYAAYGYSLQGSKTSNQGDS